jgi:hypothetical protein
MGQKGVFGGVVGYVWRFAALASIYFVGVGLMFILSSRLGDRSYESGNNGGQYTLLFIIPALPTIFLSWILHNREILRTVRFWLITAAIVLVFWALSLAL